MTAWPGRVLVVKATGRGTYARTTPDRYGFPRLSPPTDQTRTTASRPATWSAPPSPNGKKTGVHIGRVLVRSSGSFDITTRHGRVAGINHRHVRLLQRADGYGYTTQKEADRDD